MAINLKNYTTVVTAEKSIQSIEKMLVDFGCKNIMKEYSGSMRVLSISFIADVEGQRLPFKLPAQVKECYIWLKKMKPKATEKSLLDQAERITWKILSDWLHIQLSMLETKQADKLQLLLPYLQNSNNTKSFYEKLKENKFKGLLIENP